MYIATPFAGEPVEAWLLAEIDGREIVDRLFWKIVQTNWPAVVKTGCMHPSSASPCRELFPPLGGEDRELVSGRHERNRERSPPS